LDKLVVSIAGVLIVVVTMFYQKNLILWYNEFINLKKGNSLKNKKMIADLVGANTGLNVSVEVQRDEEEGFAVRSSVSSSNVMREGLEAGSNYTKVRDTIGINILNFELPELSNKKDFFTRIVRADYDTGEHFLADKFSDYYLELPKLPKTKENLSEDKKELWELCTILKTKLGKIEEVIEMEKIESPVALKFAEEFKKTMGVYSVVDDVLSYEEELELIELVEKQGIEKGIEQGIEQGIEKGIEQGIEKGIEQGIEKGREEVLMLTAKNMLNMNLTLEQIKQATGLDINTIKKLQNEI